MEEQTNFEAKWNAAGSMSQEMMRLRINANKCYVKGDFTAAFKFLSAIKMTIVASLDEDERKSLNTLEIDFLKHDSLNRSIHPQNKKGQVYHNLHMKIVSGFLKFNNELMDAIQKHKLGMGEKDDTSIID